MRYVAVVDGAAEPVSIVEEAPDCFVVQVGTRRLAVRAHARADGAMTLWADGAVHPLHVERRGELRRVHTAAGACDVEVRDLRRHQLSQARARGPAAGDASLLRAPMAGRVAAILTQPGATVRQGQGLVVVEAMKMENELRAPRDGVVAEIPATVGAAVDRGAPLCRLE